MIITRTPFRISFVGGGSDLEDFYSKYTGAVLSTSINKYMYISSHDYFDPDTYLLKYSKTEIVNDLNRIEHTIFKEVLSKYYHNKGIEISSNADIPSGTGLGSSSSFTVCLLHNIYTKMNIFVTKEKLASEACDIEINLLKEPIGKQDQYSVAFGGLNVIQFNPEGTVNVRPVHLKRATYEKLQENLLLFYTGTQRKTSSILTEQKKNLSDQNKLDTLREMVGLVWKLEKALYSDDLALFGKILHENWLLKKQLADKISNQSIDGIYELALKNGATGGKLLGAGGGGFLLLYCEKENQNQLKESLKQMKCFKFRFDNEGSKVIYIGDENE